MNEFKYVNNLKGSDFFYGRSHFFYVLLGSLLQWDVLFETYYETENTFENI
jgi:hypothetical protein